MNSIFNYIVYKLFQKTWRKTGIKIPDPTIFEIKVQSWKSGLMWGLIIIAIFAIGFFILSILVG